jgi:glutaredoxin
MGRKSNAKKEPRRTASGAAGKGNPNWPLVALSLFGCALAGYLSYTSWVGEAVKGCGVGSACDVVLSSRWATLLDLPTAFWGVMAYASLAAIAFLFRGATQWRWSWTLAFFGVLYSAYLTTISLTVLGAACPYCLTSLTLMTAIFALITFQRPAGAPASWLSWLTPRVIVSVGLIGFLHLNYMGVVGKPPAVEDPVSRALAVHLADKGAKMYGASWCPHCQDQKAMFGAAARRLPYIECSMGPTQGSPQTSECNRAGIQTYPTWEIDGKRYPEVLSIQRLAEMTGFDLAAAIATAAAAERPANQ